MKSIWLAVATSLSAMSAPALANPPAVCLEAPNGVAFPDSRATVLAPADVKTLFAAAKAGVETLQARLDGNGAVVVDERTAIVRTAKGAMRIGLIDMIAPTDREFATDSHILFTDGVDTIAIDGQVSGSDPLVITVHRAIADMNDEVGTRADTTHLVDPKSGAILVAYRCFTTDGPQIAATWTREGKGWRVDACGESKVIADATIKACAAKPNQAIGTARGWVRKLEGVTANGNEKALENAIRTLNYIAEVWAPTRQTAADMPELWLNLARAHATAATKKFSVGSALAAEMAYRSATAGSKDATYLADVAMFAGMAAIASAMQDPAPADDFLGSSSTDLVDDLEKAVVLFELARGHGGPGAIIDEYVKLANERIKALKGMVEAP